MDTFGVVAVVALYCSWYVLVGYLKYLALLLTQCYRSVGVIFKVLMFVDYNTSR